MRRDVYRAIDQYGQVVDVFVSTKRDANAARRFFANAIGAPRVPRVMTTDRSPVSARTIVELLPTAHHGTTRYANNRTEAHLGGLKAAL